MPVIMPNPKPKNRKLGMGPAVYVLTSPPGDAGTCPGWRTAGWVVRENFLEL